MTPDRVEEFEERAGILEHESGRYVSRGEAERIAAEYLKLTQSEIVYLKDSGIARF
jgi:hypothetical protein